LLTHYLPPDGPFTVEKIEQEIASRKKEPLGVFMKHLRKRVDIDPTFDGVLTQFLQRRNEFVHRFVDVPGFGLSDPEQTKFTLSYAMETAEMARNVRGVLKGLIDAIARALGIVGPREKGADIDIDTIYEWNAMEWLKPKL